MKENPQHVFQILTKRQMSFIITIKNLTGFIISGWVFRLKMKSNCGESIMLKQQKQK